MKVIKLRDDI